MPKEIHLSRPGMCGISDDKKGIMKAKPPRCAWLSRGLLIGAAVALTDRVLVRL